MTEKKVARKATKTAKPVAKKAGGEAEGLAKIAAMPAYAKDGKVICFFRADKFMTFGLTGKANHALDRSAPHQLRESAWFFTALDDSTVARLSDIVRKAAS
jgi:hypothetical protein